MKKNFMVSLIISAFMVIIFSAIGNSSELEKIYSDFDAHNKICVSLSARLSLIERDFIYCLNGAEKGEVVDSVGEVVTLSNDQIEEFRDYANINFNELMLTRNQLEACVKEMKRVANNLNLMIDNGLYDAEEKEKMCQIIEHEKELIEKNLNILEKTKKYDGYNP